MNFETAFINCVLKSDAPKDTLVKVKSSGITFSKRHLSIFEFLESYINKYEKLPSEKTISDKFKEGWKALKPEYEAYSEPFDYYMSEFKVEKNWLRLQEIQAKASEASNPLDAIAIYQRELALISTVEAVSNDARLNDPKFVQNLKDKRDGIIPKGVDTGIEPIDSLFLGLQPDDFWLFTAATKSFKTWIMLHIALNMVKAGRKVLFFTKEMNESSLLRRLWAIIKKCNFQTLRESALSDKEILEILDEIASYTGEFIIVGRDEGSSFDMNLITRKSFEYKEADVIFIDGIYLFAKSVDWKDQVEFSTALRDLCLSVKKPFITTTQLNSSDEVAYSKYHVQSVTAQFKLKALEDKVTKRSTNNVNLWVDRSRDTATDGFMIDGNFKSELPLNFNFKTSQLDIGHNLESVASYEGLTMDDVPFEEDLKPDKPVNKKGKKK